jgi:exodeoxyribonuclease VIII
MKNVMVDLETLALDSNALILSIGAVEFDPRDAGDGLGRVFYTVVNQDLQVSKWKRVVSPSTLKWWGEQGAEAQKVLYESSPEAYAPLLDTSLMRFQEWLGGPANIWGYGAHFDNVVLANAYSACNLHGAWAYGQNRCHRTLKALGPDLSLVVPINACEHNSLEDAKYQARWAVEALRRMGLEAK